jgi:hypothetical protein
MRAGRSFGVILDAEDRQFFMPHSFNGVVIQINMTDFDVLWQRFGIDRETVVLRRDRDPAAP